MFDRRQGGQNVYLIIPSIGFSYPTKTSIAEFESLSRTTGAKILGQVVFKIKTPNPKYFMGLGKIEQIKQSIIDLKVDLIIIDELISASQQKNIEEKLECRVLDRTGLILDIFATSANTYEGKLQVELAQLQYISTRLIRGWTHLERQKGGIGLRGPGETQLESDRRIISLRIKSIKSRLEKVKKQRMQGRSLREKNNIDSLALVGYTNSGKSSLFNLLTKSNVLVQDKLFATLDPSIAKLYLSKTHRITCADTVGFINKLPHTLIEAFKTTLQETTDANLLLIVVDSSDEECNQHIMQVKNILKEIKADNIPFIMVYNKIDLTNKKPKIIDNQDQPIRVYISVKEKLGIDVLIGVIADHFAAKMHDETIILSADEQKQKSWLYKHNYIEQELYQKDGSSKVNIKMPKHQWQNFNTKFINQT